MNWQYFQFDALGLTDIERSGFAHSYSANMHALTGRLRHIRPQHVTGLKTANTLVHMQ
jgi:hypothetical protein